MSQADLEAARAAQAARFAAEKGPVCLADCQFPCASHYHRVKDDTSLRWPAENAPLKLARDLQNTHDTNAISVLSDAHIGYVPGRAAATLAPLLFRPGGEPSGALRLDASAVSGPAVRLRVFAADGADVPPGNVSALADFAKLHPPPAPTTAASNPRRIQPDSAGWVTLSLPAEHLDEVLAANAPSSFSRKADIAWVCARRRDDVVLRSGKWLLFVNAAQDSTWVAIVRALQAGNLGPSAKTAPPDGSSRAAMFCVYTRDWEDRADVLRVGLALRAATGWTGAMSYKTDAHTHAGAYSGNGQSVCCYTLSPDAAELTVKENVLAVARALVGSEEPQGGAKRPRAADAAPVEVIDLCSDSDEEGAGAHKARRSV